MKNDAVRVAFVGGGAMADAILKGAVASGIVTGESVTVSDPVERRRALMADQYGAHVTADNAEAVRGSDVVVLAVKPQVLPVVVKPLSSALADEQVLVSIVAGKSVPTLVKMLSHDRVVRVMPNTPAQVGQGMTVWTAAAPVTAEQKTWVGRLLGALGRERYVDDERYLDMATAISGSGPAYVFLVIEALVDAGVHIGLPRVLAQELAVQTVLGSASLAKESGSHPAVLRNLVTSPGGTTAAALQVLERHALRAALLEAVIAAYEKAQALGRMET